MTCLDCGVRLSKRHGTRRHEARGLCGQDWQRRKMAGTLGDRPTLSHLWADYADDYAMLRAEGYPLDVIASRLDWTLDALDRALTRHRDDPRARRPVRSGLPDGARNGRMDAARPGLRKQNPVSDRPTRTPEQRG